MRFSCCALIALAGVALFGAESGTVTLKAIPEAMRWSSPPASFAVRGDNTIEIVSPRQTDWFISPLDGATRANSPRLTFEVTGDFVLSARVTVDFQAKWDGGVLLAYEDETHWAKLCLENSVYEKPTIVSVVTRGASDDSNGVEVDGNSMFLQMARVGPALVFYGSPDGHTWRIIRAFTLGDIATAGAHKLQLGFSSQSPTGPGHKTVFSNIQFRSQRPVDWWRGE